MILSIVAFLFVNCNKNDSDGFNNNGQVTVKGTISAKGAKKLSGTKGSLPLSIADAKKVMVFSGSKYTLSNIVDSSFTVTADAGSANALVFLDAQNKFIGVLCTEGLNVLPLIGLDDGDKTIIDLQIADNAGRQHNPHA